MQNLPPTHYPVSGPSLPLLLNPPAPDSHPLTAGVSARGPAIMIQPYQPTRSSRRTANHPSTLSEGSGATLGTTPGRRRPLLSLPLRGRISWETQIVLKERSQCGWVEGRTRRIPMVCGWVCQPEGAEAPRDTEWHRRRSLCGLDLLIRVQGLFHLLPVTDPFPSARVADSQETASRR